MKTCRSVRKKLSAYQDRELIAADKDAVETHLRTCDACRKRSEALRHTYRMLRSLPEIQPAAGLARQIVDRATRLQEPFWVRTLGEAFRLLPARAAIVMLAASGLLIGTILGNALTKGQFHSSPASLDAFSDQALTLASVKVFDTTPPGSFAEGYLKLAIRNQEIHHEK